MKDLFILIAGVGIAFNLYLITHKGIEYAKITKDIILPYHALEVLNLELREYCIGKLQATLIYIIILAFIVFYF